MYILWPSEQKLVKKENFMQKQKGCPLDNVIISNYFNSFAVESSSYSVWSVNLTGGKCVLGEEGALGNYDTHFSVLVLVIILSGI